MIRQIGKFEFDENSSAYKKFKREIPAIVANEAVNHFKEGFLPENSGRRTDASKDGWAKRRTDNKSDKRLGGNSRAILVQTGKLKRLEKTKESFDMITISSPTEAEDYAQRHNQGLAGMPKREFLGDSKELTDKLEKTILKELEKVMK